MDLFRPDLARTFRPGCSVVPAADLDMFRTCKSSIHTIAWFWLIAVEVLCRKSRRALPIREGMGGTRAVAFVRVLRNLLLRLVACCGLGRAVSCRVERLGGAEDRRAGRGAEVVRAGALR